MDDMIEGTSLVRTEDDLSETNFDHSDIVDNYSEVLITFFLKNQWKYWYFKQICYSFVSYFFVEFDFRAENVELELIEFFKLISKLIVNNHNKNNIISLNNQLFLLHLS